MGDLIIMKRPQGSSREYNPAGVSAEILFFTGVRYYRMEEEVSPQTVVRRRRSEKANQAAKIRRAKRLTAPPTPVSA